MSRTSLVSILALGALVVGAVAALAQTPTQAQQKALRANCPGDFREHCDGVPTGGMDALVCLEKNVNALSPGCKAAVEAIDPQPAATASSGGATTETAATPPAAPSSPPAASSPPSTSTTSAAPAAPPTSGQADHEPPLTMRQEMALAAGACAVDFRLLCPNLPVGHGNILFCLRVHSHRLAPACREALVRANVPLR